jgi:putative glutamine amidotransferase
MTPDKSFSVNSLHSQGIDRLAPGLRAEAVSPDGQIEAVSLPAAKGFLFAVQWHPEWAWSENSVSRAIYGAFGEALRKRPNST